MFVELVYDKRNVEGLPGAREIILNELTKRVHQLFPDAQVKVKPMQANALNSDCTKTEKERRTVCWKRCLKRLICGWSPNNVPSCESDMSDRKQRPEALSVTI